MTYLQPAMIVMFPVHLSDEAVDPISSPSVFLLCLLCALFSFAVPFAARLPLSTLATAVSEEAPTQML